MDTKVHHEETKSSPAKSPYAGNMAMNSLRSSIESAPPRLKTGAKRLLVGAIAIFLAITAWKYYSYKSEEARARPRDRRRSAGESGEGDPLSGRTHGERDRRDAALPDGDPLRQGQWVFTRRAGG